MPADLDLSPEAVERLARELEDEALAAQRDAWGRADGGFDCSISAMLADNAASTIRALAAENARLRAERDEQRERAEEAESEITRAQEQVSAEFEGDCWKVMRNLLDRTDFDWPQYGDYGVTADDAHRWIVEELDRLEAERDAAWQAGAVAMREASAICERIRDKKCENDDQAIGALECTLAIQDAIAAMDTPKGGENAQ